MAKMNPSADVKKINKMHADVIRMNETYGDHDEELGRMLLAAENALKGCGRILMRYGKKFENTNEESMRDLIEQKMDLAKIRKKRAADDKLLKKHKVGIAKWFMSDGRNNEDEAESFFKAILKGSSDLFMQRRRAVLQHIKDGTIK